MNNTNKNQVLNKATELLPWYAVGKLSPNELSFMTEAIASYPELKSQLEIEQSMIQLVKNNADILNASAIEAPEDRVNHILDLLDEPSLTTLKQEADDSNVNQSLPKNKLKQFFDSLFPRSSSLGAYQYAGVALVIFALVAIVNNTFNKAPEVIQESVFYPAAKQNATFKNKKDHTVLLLGVSGKLDSPKLLKLLQKVEAEISAVPEKDGMYRVTLGKKLSSITINALLDELRAEKELVWFAGESN